jgi:hypothetical protein
MGYIDYTLNREKRGRAFDCPHPCQTSAFFGRDDGITFLKGRETHLFRIDNDHPEWDAHSGK